MKKLKQQDLRVLKWKLFRDKGQTYEYSKKGLRFSSFKGE
jgi:hypothetical protein